MTVYLPALVMPDEVRDAMAELGRQLARYRKAAGLTQHDLAKGVRYSRSTIANVETGHNIAPQPFWLSVDRAVHAEGLLIKTAAHVASLKRACAAEQRRQPNPATACAHSCDCPCSIVVARWTGYETRALREALRLDLTAFAAAIDVPSVTVLSLEGPPWPEPPLTVQTRLDRTLLHAAPDARARFRLLLSLGNRAQRGGRQRKTA